MVVANLRDQLRDQSGAYMPRILACFYAVFDEKQGPKVVAQVPEGTIATALSTFPTSPPVSDSEPQSDPHAPSSGMVRSTSNGISSTQVLFDFSSILDFVIPKPELCGHLITKATRTSKILGFPVRIYDEEKYHKGKENHNRNAFLFNLCFVFEREAELSSFEPIVRKAGRTLRMMEESDSFLSSPPPDFQMTDLLEQIYLDLNVFSEASIRIQDTQLELWLLPFYANPREIKHWDVPIAVAPLEAMKNSSWDVTLFKVCPFIDGVNHVKRIAELAEVDHNLARLCIQHLVFYSAVILVDLFQFSNSYAAVAGITDIVQYGEEEDEGVTDLRAECENYVYNGTGDTPPTPFSTLLSLYSKLAPGLSVGTWIDKYNVDSYPIDVRRMIQFGVIKGFLRRVHAYPVWLDHPTLVGAMMGNTPRRKRRSKTPSGFGSSGIRRPLAPNDSDVSLRPDLSRAGSSLFSGSSATGSASAAPTPPPKTPIDAPAPPKLGTAGLGTKFAPDPETPKKLAYPSSLPYMLDGRHSMDEICIRYGMGFRAVEVVLRELGGATKVDDGTGSEDEGGSRVVGGAYGSRIVMMHV